jgi:hypothetical protein
MGPAKPKLRARVRSFRRTLPARPRPVETSGAWSQRFISPARASPRPLRPAAGGDRAAPVTRCRSSAAPPRADQAGAWSRGRRGGQICSFQSNGGGQESPLLLPPIHRSSPEGSRKLPPIRRRSPEDSRKLPPIRRSSPEDSRKLPPIRRSSPEGSWKLPPIHRSLPEGSRRLSPIHRSLPEGSRRLSPIRRRSPEGSWRLSPIRRRSRKCSPEGFAVGMRVSRGALRGPEEKSSGGEGRRPVALLWGWKFL